VSAGNLSTPLRGDRSAVSGLTTVPSMLFRPVEVPGDLAALQHLFELCRTADGHWPLGEHKYLDLVAGSGGDGIGLVGESDGELLAYTHLTPSREPGRWTFEMAVHPLHRTLAVVEGTATTAMRSAAEHGATGLRVWVFRPAVAEVLHQLGFEEERELRQLRRSLPPEVRPHLPPGISIAGFKVGTDEEAWLDLNNRTFAGHPENGAWDDEVLADRITAPWFDPEGFRLAWRDSSLVGFCWTKLHSEDLGEIYIIGVEPELQGAGLGRALTLDGLWDLAERQGATTAMLYVDAANTRGLRLYERLGFYLDHVDRALVLRW
jgi:mycothiol synthase